MLYQFSKLNSKLDSLGFPKIEGGSGFQLIKGVNFEEAFRAGDISFETNGIYLEYEGKKYRGYMFIDLYYVNYNGQPTKYPKFHLVKCKTIQDFIDRGRFNQRYIWSNADMNDITDKQSRTVHKDVVLDLCHNCSEKLLTSDTLFEEGIHEYINDTHDFHDLLDKSETEGEQIEVDIFGYVKGKERISKAYRAKMNYTCENCGIKSKGGMDKRWWHTHHIDGDKTHNDESNLECLCVLCHANKDSRHQENFAVNRMKIEIEHFIKKYRKNLQELGNPYLVT
ncbi:hypothetical protein E1J38_002360 [Seonamhaeicola sediminis]|uniref:HNH nuclease domain-containing protein n=1 Tax=Seonamhaeicola sediminis TaxID=2528206 RepID=A0A562YI27_9FLAO|nr:hypothetical protein [Seonamhaeicola sediminis]TWO34722.1 hypothetical protein E1J38_002360 [Seonamhaeicola sediminis]